MSAAPIAIPIVAPAKSPAIETTTDMAARFLTYLEAVRQASPHTLRAYRFELDGLARWLWAHHPEAVADPLAITAKILRGYVVSRVETGIGNSTTLRLIAALKSFGGYMVRTERVVENPAGLLRTKVRPRRMARCLDEGEAVALVEAPTGDDFAGIRDRAMLEVLYSTGIRAAELSAMDYGHIQWVRSTVTIRGKGRRERIAVLGAPAIEALRGYLQARAIRHPDLDQAGALFVADRSPGRRLGTRDMGRVVKRYQLAAKVTGKVSPHTFRHSFATHMMRAGANIREVQEFLGHKSIDTTAIYSQMTIVDLQRVYNATHPLAMLPVAAPVAEPPAPR